MAILFTRGWTDYLLALVPIFVAMSALSVLPVYIALTEGMAEAHRRTVARQAIATGFGVAVAFLAVGKSVFHLMGITIADFQAAGGLVLLVLSIYDLLFSTSERRSTEGEIGAVPIGVPLIVGPAVLTTMIITVDTYGFLPTLISLMANLLFAWFVFSNGERILDRLGAAGAKAVAKVASLLLAAFAAAMIRIGITAIIHGAGG